MPSSASFGSIFTLSKSPCGDCMSRIEEIRPATSSSDSTSSARFIRRSLPTRFVTAGIPEPRGRSKRSAGPPDFTARSDISVISSTGSTSAEIRLQLALFVQLFQKVPEIAIRHFPSPQGSRSVFESKNSCAPTLAWSFAALAILMN